MAVGSRLYPIDNIFIEGINEVIVSTCYNAAPMGIILKNNSLSMIVFRTSHTAENIIRDGWIVAHITHDPVLFVRTTFEDLSSESYVEEKIGEYHIQRLRSVQNWILCKAQILNKTSEKIFVGLEPVHIALTPEPPHPVHRGFNNVIEATVHATRYILYQDMKLAELIRHHGDLVMRCGGESEKRAMKLLYTFVNSKNPGAFFE
ncbi:DUF447 domain-containing protein [Methanospirillum sp.]